VIDSKKSSSAKRGTYKPLTYHIASLDVSGNLVLSFSEDILQVPNLTLLTNGTIEIDDVVYPVLHLEVEEGHESNPYNLRFSWEAIRQTNRTLVIKISWESAMFVSAFIPPDVLKVTILDPLFFTAYDGRQIKLDDRVLRRILPPQLSGSATAFYWFSKVV